jgi:hypothetical protein
MHTFFELPVTYKGEEHLFPARLLSTGFVRSFSVTVNNQELLFEPDEEQFYRAIFDPDKTDETKRVDVELLAAIADTLRALVT